MSFILVAWLITNGVSIDMGVLVGGMVLAFATQTVAGWMKITSLQRDVGSLADDIQELQVLHPRQGNPGRRVHSLKQYHNEEDKKG